MLTNVKGSAAKMWRSPVRHICHARIASRVAKRGLEHRQGLVVLLKSWLELPLLLEHICNVNLCLGRLQVLRASDIHTLFNC